MINSKELISNLGKLHTTELGKERIKKNLKLSECDVVEYCRKIITAKECSIYREGKNWYCRKDEIEITVNAYSFTIITAHILNK